MAKKDLARSALNEIELKALEHVLYATADIIDALMKDGLPYTKLIVQGGQDVRNPTAF